jgi:hypothetical protein
MLILDPISTENSAGTGPLFRPTLKHNIHVVYQQRRAPPQASEAVKKYGADLPSAIPFIHL